MILNLNYAIFRSEPIYTLNDLSQIGSHNKREKKSYNSNPDIDINLSKDNIELVPLTEKYVKGFYNLTKEYKKEHDKRMKTERDDRKKTFKQMLDKSKNVVADELLFTATNEFFKNMTKDDIKEWADTCMEFVYQDLGYTKEQVLHASVHLDEKTPHIHCVVVPLVKKFDKRTNTERYTISKKQYIKDKIHLSELQDKYHQRLTEKGYDLERGIKNSDNKHIDIKQYKKITRKLNIELTSKNEKLNKSIEELENKINSNKEMIFDKEYVKVKKDTFDSMNKVIEQTKKVAEIQPKIQNVYNEINEYAKSYKALEIENKSIQKEVKNLKNINQELVEENNNLISYIDKILNMIKNFFRKMLKIGNEYIKDETTWEIEKYYNNNDFGKDDIYDISKGTSREDELFEYANIDKYYSTNKDDDFDISL